MIYKFKKGKQKELIQKAIGIAGSERKLAKVSNIPLGSIYHLKFEKRNLSSRYAERLFKVLKIEKDDVMENISEILPDNWGRQKGGANLIRIKIEKGILGKTIQALKKSSSKRMKEWHKNMKENEPEKYYKWQYERFKKIGKGYQFRLSNGIKVRNSLERDLGNFLLKLFPEVKYEEYVNISGNAYFPDFIYKNKIIEATEWKNPSKEKICCLKRKAKDYEKGGYSVRFFIPERYRKFYKVLGNIIISDLSELKDFIVPP